MIKVSGTFDRAFGCLTVGQYTNARRDLMQALGLDLNSRSAFGKYLNGTTALHTVALMKGASILRVHDVKEAVETVKLYINLRNS